jgi:DNA recombination protein RmuC
LEFIFAAIAGLIVGIVAAWLLLRQQIAAAFEQGKVAAQPERATLLERLANRDADVVRLESRLAAAESKEGAIAELKAQNAGLAAELRAERALGAEKLALLEKTEEQLQNVFRALSAQALQANNQAFLDLAKETLGKFQQGAQGELEKRQQAIQEIVGPVKVSLDKLDGRIQEIERTREGAYQALTTQVRSLAQGQGDLQRETGNLVRALRQPMARGRWGELQLRRVVEMAGMLEHCDFVEQATVEGVDGRLRPDLVVRLAGGRNLVIDAKTPLTAYLDAIEAQNDEVRKQLLVEHARQVRDHITKLGRKSYQEQFDPTPEIVVMFLPGEMFFSAALEQDPELIEFGVGEKVIPATPTTLIAMLRAIAYGWKQEALARNAQEISELGRELHERISVMAAHWGRVGKNLGDAVGAYNNAVASLESRVLPAARRFKELKAVPDGREIAPIEQVEALPRALQAPELQAPELEAPERPAPEPEVEPA